MPPDLLIVVPVLRRPHRAEPLAQSCAEAATVPHRLMFVCSDGDDAQIAACKATGADVAILPGEWEPGDFARKVNQAYRLTTEPFLFQAADDLDFEKGWDAEVLRVIEDTETGVCGTNDEANAHVKAGLHSTHSLIRRAYVDECGASLDGPGSVFSETYHHNFCDTELVGLARARSCFSFARQAIVRHRHPIWGTEQNDEIYEIGSQSYATDRMIYNARAPYWGGP